MVRRSPYRDRSREPCARGRTPDPYTTRLLACLAVSLALVIVLVRSPWTVPLYPVGWQTRGTHFAEDLTVIDVKPASPLGAPITRFERAERPDRGTAEVLGRDAAAPLPPPSPPDAPAQRLTAREAVLEVADVQPDIVGGLSAYYIHIEYPEDAIAAGIEGRLVLEFVVGTDGRATGITVLLPLFPSCDSAAVRALRSTRFIPGRRAGEAVRVRMRLPVRFELIAPRDEAAQEA